MWINEENLALDFSCNRCLHPPALPLDDVLDLEEAAAAIGTDPSRLADAADRGQVAHRKTGGGVYLFVRKDLDALSR